MSMPNDAAIQEKYPYFFLPRPEGQLRSLPVKMRWEVTRRHPIYSRFWKSARDFYEGATDNDPHANSIRAIAAKLMPSIGVSGSPPNPSLEFEELDGASAVPEWLSGAISPVSLRSLFGLLIAGLPPETFLHCCVVLAHEMGSDQDPELRRLAGLKCVPKLTLPEGGQYIDEPIVAINPRFANREIEKELKPLLDRWREERDIKGGRNRSDKNDDYLQVWDLREGWSKGEYHNDRELMLKEVAKTVGRKPSNVNKQYRMAFQLITGHEYSRPMWLSFMGILKLSKIASGESGRISRHLPLASSSRRDVPDSVVTPSGSSQSMTQQVASGDGVSEILMTDAVLDIESLVKKGKSDEEIFDALEVPPSCAELAELINLIRAGGGLGDRP